MGFFIMERIQLNEVNEAVDSITPGLQYSSEGFVDTNSLIKAVSAKTGIDIDFTQLSFKKFDDEDISDYGAMMCTMEDNDQVKAKIILNDDRDARFQRFSLAHELGHLMVDQAAIPSDSKKYIISTHIKYDMTDFDQEDCKNPRISRELQANAFALKVLMPSEYFFEKLFNGMTLDDIAKSFGVSESAARSRALLGF